MSDFVWETILDEDKCTETLLVLIEEEIKADKIDCQIARQNLVPNDEEGA